MDDFEFACVNYRDLSDHSMCGEWKGLRVTLQVAGAGDWSYRVDEGRVKQARVAYEMVKRLAEAPKGKASLLIDRGLGLCLVRLENVPCLTAYNRLERKRLFTLLSWADGITFVPGTEEDLCLKLSYQAFHKVD